VTWPALVLWTVALVVAMGLARPGLRTRHPLLGLLPLVALTGVGLWLAYLVLDGSGAIAWVALGLAAAGLVVTLLGLLRPEAGPASVVDVVVWGGAGVLVITFALTAVVCLFAGLGYQSPG
jgi:hypothetical protein